MDQIIPSNIPNFTLLCRLCLCEDVYMFPIFNETNIYLPQRIAACVNVEVYKSDIISTLICKQCLKKINDWHEFKKYCNDSQTKLRYWSNLSATNDPIDYKSTNINIKEEIYDEEETIIPENVEDIKPEPTETYYEDFSINDELSDEESDPVSTTMYFLPDEENCEIEPELETLLVPTYELSPDAHGLTGPSLLNEQPAPAANPDGVVDLKIAQVYQVISCRICEINFGTLAKRSLHEKKEHRVNFKEMKCFACNKVWNDEEKLLAHYNSNHLNLNESNFIKPENKFIKNGYAYNTVEKSQEYLKQFAANLILLRNRAPSAKQISLKSFTYYNQCIQKMIDRNSIDLNTSITDILENLFSQNLIIKNSCHQCCVSFRGVTEFEQHISKRYCKKRVRLVESGQIQPNQHFKCLQCDRIFGCITLLTHHIKSEHASDDVPVPVRCAKCTKPFQYRHEYNAHIQETCSYQICCSICELLFNTTDDFKLHSKVQHDIGSNSTRNAEIFHKIPREQWKNKCCVCSKDYSYHQHLGRHFRSSHPELVLHTCKYCGKNYVREEELQTHINTFHLKKNVLPALKDGSNNRFQKIYLCADCDLVFNTVEDLEQHKIVHTASGSGNEFRDFKNIPLESPLFTCNICVQTFNCEEKLNHHKIIDHGEIKGSNGQIKFTCTDCRKSFNTNKALVAHNFQKHGIKKKKKCLKCLRTFKNLSATAMHMKFCNATQMETVNKRKLLKVEKMEVEDVDTCACIVCEKVFNSRRSLLGHARMHYQYNKLHGPHCEVCGITCDNVQDLLDHFKSHPSELLNNLYNLNSTSQKAKEQKLQQKQQNEHKCNICCRYFTTKFGLNMHFALKHRKTKPFTYNCIICDESFESKPALIKHVQEHIKNEDRFMCKKCNIAYLSDDYLTHMSQVHCTHACILCNKMFLTYSSLMSHKGWHYR